MSEENKREICKDAKYGNGHRICDCNQKYINNLENKNKSLEAMCDKLADHIKSTIGTRHSECEDAWYSCPKSEDGCANDNFSPDECTCGLDYRNEKASKVLSEYKQLKGE